MSDDNLDGLTARHYKTTAISAYALFAIVFLLTLASALWFRAATPFLMGAVVGIVVMRVLIGYLDVRHEAAKRKAIMGEAAEAMREEAKQRYGDDA